MEYDDFLSTVRNFPSGSFTDHLGLRIQPSVQGVQFIDLPAFYATIIEATKRDNETVKEPAIIAQDAIEWEI